MSQKKNLALHLGTHKSASTYLIRSLHDNRELLEKNGVALITPKPLRLKYGITSLVNKTHFETRGYANNAKKIKNLFKDIIEEHDSERLIISEENFLGFCGQWNGSDEIYPQADKNLKLISEALSEFDTEIFLCIRNLKSFLPSAYCEYLRHTGYVVSFADFIKNYDFSKVNWYNFVMRIATAFPSSHLKVWDFDSNFNPVTSQLIIKKLCGQNSMPYITLREKPVRKGINCNGINLLVGSFGKLTIEEWADLRKFVDGNDLWTMGKKFMPWSSIEVAFFDQKHEISLNQIANAGGNIELIR